MYRMVTVTVKPTKGFGCPVLGVFFVEIRRLNLLWAIPKQSD